MKKKNTKNENNEQKILWYDTLTKILNLGFDLEKNNAFDLLAAVNELIRYEENNNKKRINKGEE